MIGTATTYETSITKQGKLQEKKGTLSCLIVEGRGGLYEEGGGFSSNFKNSGGVRMK